MKSSNNSSIATSNDNDSHNDTIEINPMRPKRYYGNITIDMIDDFFNPLTQKKDPTKVNLFKPIPPPTTNGLGIIKHDLDEKKQAELEKEPFNERDFKNNTDYAREAKKQYEKELYQSASAFYATNSVCNFRKDDHSIVGSGMSQIESVSSMNMSMNAHLRTMNQAKLLNKITDDQSSIDLNNNRLANEIDEASKLKLEDFEQKKQEDIIELAKTYQFRQETNSPNLPITSKRKNIISFINSYQFCIIRGGTGCGKTTQVPQFILDDHISRKKYCNIIVTQPRRIAAISVAKRVCSERSWQLGDLCGYQIGLERQYNPERTHITYVTTGVLLQKLIGSQAEENFNKYTHIILDEVHERDLDTDFVLLIIKLKSFRNLTARIILMSATIDCDAFSKYYAIEQFNEFNEEGKRVKKRVPILDVENSAFKVQEFYWEDLVSNHSFLSHTIQASYQSKLDQAKKVNIYQKYHNDSIYQRSYGKKNSEQSFGTVKSYKQHIQTLYFNYDQPELSQETMQMCINLLRYFDDEDLRQVNDTTDSDNDNLNSTLSSLNTNDDVPRRDNRLIDGLAEKRGSVLIFVPGMHDIQSLNDLIMKEFTLDYKLDIYPLHSEIPLSQQQRVFSKSKSCHRKIIISTSIAESSITVSDIKYVIDFCLTKELYSDPQTNYSHLRQEWASKSSLKQRRGRAGRVSDGICYRLITRDLYNSMDEYTKSAILREPLTKTILNVKRLQITGDPKKVLSMAIEPPMLSDIERNVLLLKEVGALTLTHKKQDGSIENDPHDGDLTYAGKIMSELPIDVRLSKLILLGHAFGKLKEAITIAAGLSTKAIFTSLFKSYLEAYKSKWLWASGWMCDCLAILNVCQSYDTISHNSHRDRLTWAREKNIELNRLCEVLELRKELEQRLMHLDIRTSSLMNANATTNRVRSRAVDDDSKPYDLDDEDQIIDHYLIIKMMIAGAFYPNYLNSNTLDLQETYKLVGFHDIKKTVMVKNIPNNEGILYENKIIDLFRPCSNAITVHSEDTKSYIVFKEEHEIKSNINFSVYLAVEMRLIRAPMQLRKYIPIIAQEKLKRIKQNQENRYCDISVDKGASSIMRFKIASSLSLNRSRALFSDSEVSLNNTLTDDTETNTEADFMIAKDKVDDLDQSRFLSYASVITNFKDSIKRAESIRNLETSSRISAGRGRASSITGSLASLAQKNNYSINQLASNRVTSAAEFTIVDHLRNPKFLLPEKVDHGEPVEILITDIVECGHFWAQINDPAHIKTISDIQEFLNNKSSKSMSDLSSSLSSLNSVGDYKLKQLNQNDIVLNALCITNYSIDNNYYRAQIININKTEQKATVLFIDFGNKEKKSFKELFVMSMDLHEYPFQALECKLSNIKMSIFKNPNSIWTKSANDYFNKKILKNQGMSRGSFVIKVVDLIETVAMVQLISEPTNKDIADEIVSAGYAEKVDTTNLESKMCHYQKGSENLIYLPSRQTDYTARRPNIAGGIISQEFGNQFNVRSKMNQTLKVLNDSINDSYDDYDHGDDSSQYSETTTNHILHDDDSCYSGVIDLNGPYSPLEVSYSPLVNIGKSKKTRITRGSINHVTLDDDPFNSKPRLMISNEIFLNTNGDTMVMRNTTLMPNIPGLTHLCCLLFTPIVEFRVDDKKPIITGALCGLGTNNGIPIHNDNDIETTFDINIDSQDIKMINQVRLIVNTIIGNEELAKEWTNDDTRLKSLQQKACQRLLDVIRRERKSIEPIYPNKAFKWNQINPNQLKKWNYNEAKQVSGISSGSNQSGEYYTYHHLVSFE